MARTFENTCALVFCNVGGERGRGERGSWAGGSQVAVPFVGALPGKLGWEEGMSVVELDMEICEFTVFFATFCFRSSEVVLKRPPLSVHVGPVEGFEGRS